MRAETSVVRGYTLIEVLVAMMLLALVLTVLMSTFSTGLRTVDRTQAYSRAMLLAESRLASLGVTEPLRVGEFSGAEGDLAWQIRVKDFAIDNLRVDDDDLPAAYEVHITVTWPPADDVRGVSLSSMKLSYGDDRW